MSGTKVQLRYQRRIGGTGGGSFLPLVLMAEWTTSPSGTGRSLVGFERRLNLTTRDPKDIARLPVVMDFVAPPADAGPDPAVEERRRLEEERKRTRELAARRAVRSAYHELTNAVHAVNTVALGLRDVARKITPDGDGGILRIANPRQLAEDTADLVVAGAQADIVSKAIQVLDRDDGEGGSEEAFPVFSELRSLASEVSRLSEGSTGIVLVLPEDTPRLPVMEGKAVVDAGRSAIAHAIKHADKRCVVVAAGVSRETGRFTLEVVHEGKGLGRVSMRDITADLTAVGRGEASERLAVTGGTPLSGLRAQRLRLMAAVTTQLASDVDGTVDMMERSGVFRFAMSVPWRPPPAAQLEGDGIPELEATSRADFLRLARRDADAVAAAVRTVTGAGAAAAGGAEEEEDDQPVPPLLFATSVPAGIMPDAAMAVIMRDTPVASLFPKPEVDAETDAARASAAAKPGGRTREEREARRQTRKKERGGTEGGEVDTAVALRGRPEWETLRNRHILLIDDVATVRRHGDASLRRLGCTSVLLEDGDEIEGVLRAATRQFDAILLDIVMPRTDGGDICRMLRNKLKFSRPIIAMTGHTAATEVVRYFDMGFDVVLGKPFSVEDLATKLVEAFQRRGNAQRIRRVRARMDEDSDSKEIHASGAEAASARGSAVVVGRGGEAAGLQVTAVRARVGRNAMSASGEATPRVAASMDQALGAGDGNLRGRADLDDIGDTAEPMLGMQRGTTVGIERGGSSRQAASYGPRAKTAVLGGGAVRPPGHVDA